MAMVVAAIVPANITHRPLGLPVPSLVVDAVTGSGIRERDDDFDSRLVSREICRRPASS